jgi:hypothetical protein
VFLESRSYGAGSLRSGTYFDVECRLATSAYISCRVACIHIERIRTECHARARHLYRKGEALISCP